MGVVTLMFTCIACGAADTGSPTKVPSLMVDGKREPVCRACFQRRQDHRRANGLPEETLLPGAYVADDEME